MNGNVTIQEFYTRVVKLIEEFTGSTSNVTDDEDIKNKLPILTNQGIKKLLQVKPIIRFATLKYADSIASGAGRLYPLPDDLYQLKRVYTDTKYLQTADGRKNYLLVRAPIINENIDVEYSAFHAEINADTPEGTFIELTSECIAVLENYVAAGLTIDTNEMYANFYSEYQSGMQNLQKSRSSNVAQFYD